MFSDVGRILDSKGSKSHEFLVEKIVNILIDYM